MFLRSGFWIGLGVVVALFTAIPRTRDKHISDEALRFLLLLSLFFALVGSHVLHVVLWWRSYHSPGMELLKFWEPHGRVSFGAAAGVILAMALVSNRYKIPFLRLADAISPPVTLAYAIGRIGCFMAGCCYGKPTSVPWGVKFHTVPPNMAACYRHPTQLYEAAAMLVIFIVTLWAERFIRHEGELFQGTILLYACERFALEFFREGNVALWGLTPAQLVCMALVCLILWLRIMAHPRGATFTQNFKHNWIGCIEMLCRWLFVDKCMFPTFRPAAILLLPLVPVYLLIACILCFAITAVRKTCDGVTNLSQ